MPTVVTINRPDVVSMIQAAAERFTAGNKTEVVALALKSLLTRDERRGSLFGAHPGSVVIAEGVDLTEPVFDPDDFDALTGAEIDR